MNRASPAVLRKALEYAQLLSKSGIDFVPVPVLNEKDKEALISDVEQRLRSLEQQE